MLKITDAKHGVRLEIDGHEIKELRSVKIDASFDALVTITAEVFASKPIEVDFTDNYRVTLIRHDLRALHMLERCLWFLQMAKIDGGPAHHEAMEFMKEHKNES